MAFGGPSSKPPPGSGTVEAREGRAQADAWFLCDDHQIGGSERDRRAGQRDQARSCAGAIVSRLAEARHEPA
ncbi:hypothetical protein [Nonomuraea dietziae]|uniref:hypothetical protein n=1 Tax=Nonomuraea dietziae TaxID=65515 RepID=UPI0031E1E9DA